jgi:hypothetical protein
MANPGDPNLGDEGEHIPLEPVADAPGKSSILNPSGDRCPHCGKPMPAEAVVCMACGYDMTANRLVTPRTGVDEVDPEAEAEEKGPREFVRPGGKPMPLVIAGACVTVAAAVAAAATAPKHTLGFQAAMALLVLYRSVVYTCVGVGALWCIAKYVEERIGRLDLGMARMFLAVAVFWFVSSIHLPIESDWLERMIRWPLALGAFWLSLFILFRRSRAETLVFAILHIGAWMFVETGIQLGAWLQDAAGK